MSDNCNEFKIRENFLIFVPIIDVTRNGIASSIGILNLLNIKINVEHMYYVLKIRGYDDAAAMS